MSFPTIRTPLRVAVRASPTAHCCSATPPRPVSLFSPCCPPSLSSLPIDLLWQILSFSSLSDLPHLSRVSSSLRLLMIELQSHPPPPSSPHSPSLPFSQPFTSLFSDYQHAKPLLHFLSTPHPFTSLLTSRGARRRVLASFSHPSARLRGVLHRFECLRVLFRRKQSRVEEQSRLVDLLVALGSLLPWSLALLVVRAAVPSLVALPMKGRRRVNVAVLTRYWWLLLYAAGLTWTDVQYEVVQRLNERVQRGRRPAAVADDSDDEPSAEAENDGEGEDDEDEDGGREPHVHRHPRLEVDDANADAAEERIEDQDDVPLNDADLALQRRLLRRGEALLLARDRLQAAILHRPPSPPPLPALSDSDWLSLTSDIKATMKREQGAPLPLLLLTDLLSSVLTELYYRYLLIFSLFFLFLFWTFSLRYFFLLDGLRLVVEGLIPLIPLLAITRSLLFDPQATPTMFSVFVDSLNRPSVIVGLRSVGLGVTLAMNGGKWKGFMKRLCDGVLLPVMDVMMMRLIRVRRPGLTRMDDVDEWTSPFSIQGHDEAFTSTAEADDCAGVAVAAPQLTSPVSTLLLDHAQHLIRMLASLYGRVSYGALLSWSHVSFRVLCRILLLPSVALRSLLLLFLSPTRLSRAALLTLSSDGEGVPLVLPADVHAAVVVAAEAAGAQQSHGRAERRGRTVVPAAGAVLAVPAVGVVVPSAVRAGAVHGAGVLEGRLSRFPAAAHQRAAVGG